MKLAILSICMVSLSLMMVGANPADHAHKGPLSADQEAQYIFNELYRVMPWDQFGLPEQKVNAIRDAGNNRFKCLNSQFHKFGGLLKECKSGVPNMLAWSKHPIKAELEPGHIQSMMKSCMLGQILCGNEPNGQGMMKMYNEYNSHPGKLTKNMGDHMRKTIAVTSLPEHLRNAAIEEGKKCMSQDMPVSKPALKMLKESNQKAMEKMMMNAAFTALNGKPAPEMPNDASSARPVFEITKAAMCLVKALAVHGCYQH